MPEYTKLSVTDPATGMAKVSVYTRAEINAFTPLGSALRAAVRPVSCIDTATDQLIDSSLCGRPFAINFPIKMGGTTVANIDLPVERTYQRLAMLVPPGASATIDQSANTSCFPRDPIIFPGHVLQTNYVPDTANPPNYLTQTVANYYSPPVRGVRAKAVLSCVNKGDATPPLTPDDRDTKMTLLTGNELKPRAVVNFKFGAP